MVLCTPVSGRGVPVYPNSENAFPEGFSTRNVGRGIFFSNACQKMRGGNFVKVKKRQQQDSVRFSELI